MRKGKDPDPVDSDPQHWVTHTNRFTEKTLIVITNQRVQGAIRPLRASITLKSTSLPNRITPNTTHRGLKANRKFSVKVKKQGGPTSIMLFVSSHVFCAVLVWLLEATGAAAVAAAAVAAAVGAAAAGAAAAAEGAAGALLAPLLLLLLASAILL
jgi:hypothetical protein